MNKEKSVISAAVFFDGTGNNRVNSLNDPHKYGNTTNINSLFEICTLEDRVYIEGIGTRDNMEDSDFAKATGKNPPGYSGYSYDDKLDKAINFLKVYRKLNINNDIELFVYGFSRGATLARDFAKRALAYPNVKIKFLGIFDTVVSLFFRSTPDIYFTDHELERVDRILHFAAINEARNFFPLTSIFSEGPRESLVEIKNSNGEKIKQIFVPGAHADVGGGYIEDQENVYLNKIRNTTTALQNKLHTIKTTVKDHFYGDRRTPIWNFLLGTNVSFPPAPLVQNNMVSERQNVQIEMAKVYFIVMANYTYISSKNTIFDVEEIDFPGNNTLIELNNALTKYLVYNTPNGGPNYDYEKLANFTHISANYGAVDSKGVNQTLNTFDPELLSIEIGHITEQYLTEIPDWFNEKDIYINYGLNVANGVIPVNGPNNDEWHRKIISGL